MQTKRQIQQLLASAGLSPNKQLGQHFLVDLNLMRLLVDSAQINSDDVVLEVGCGTGSLTESLAERAGRVVAVEIDQAVLEIARGRLAEARNVELIGADILKNKGRLEPTVADALAAARKRYPGRALLVANLPYNVASPVILHLATGPIQLDAMYITVQREVAERMTAGPGSPSYGILSILLAATGDLQRIKLLKPGVFWPRPQVDSAMLGFVRSPAKCGRIRDMELLSRVVRFFMGRRRKTLRACAKSGRGRLAEMTDWPAVFESCSIDPAGRPDQLAPQDYVAMANLCAKALA